MTIEYIKRFVAVAECLNFRKAATVMSVSQPTLSYSISMLEEKLGTTLFMRNTAFVKLSSAGERFLPVAEEIIELYEKTINDISKLMDEEVG